MVILVGVDVEKANDALSGDSGHEAGADPLCIKKVRVARNRKLDLAVGHEFLCQVQLELDEEEMRCDDDDTVLLLVEEDILD